MITTDNILIYSMKMDLERLFFKNKHLRKDFLKELKFSVENYEPTEDNFKSFGIGVHMSDDETLLRFYNRHKNYFKYSKEEAESILQVEDYKSDNLYRRYILSIAKPVTIYIAVAKFDRFDTIVGDYTRFHLKGAYEAYKEEAYIFKDNDNKIGYHLINEESDTFYCFKKYGMYNFELNKELEWLKPYPMRGKTMFSTDLDELKEAIKSIEEVEDVTGEIEVQFNENF